MINNLLLMLLGGGITIGLYTSISLFMKSGKLQAEFRYLSILIFLCCINYLHPHLDLIIGQNSHFKTVVFVEPGQFLLIPFIWLYIRNHLNGVYKLKLTDIFHFIPGILVAIYLILPFSDYVDEIFNIPLTTIFLGLLLILQSVFYMTRSFKKIKEVKGSLSNELSSFKSLDIDWIQYVFKIFIFIYIINIFIYMAILHTHNLNLIKAVVSLLFLIAIIIIGHRATRREEPIPSIKTIKKVSPLSKSEITRIELKLDSVMNEGKLFLNPELTLNELAENLGCSRNEISWFLNNRVGKKFYNYINEFRTSEVIRLMNDGKRDHQKILALAFDAGFNSKPAFNSIFKKVTGKTPSEYRKTLK